MKVEDLLESRRKDWAMLESMTSWVQNGIRPFGGDAEQVIKFAALYRATCSDLAMADAYQLPPGTVAYLHQLIGKAHNQLHRSRKFQSDTWAHTIFNTAPRQIFSDPCVNLAAILFFGLFFLCAWLAWSQDTFPDFAEQMAGKEMLEEMESNFSQPFQGNFDSYAMGAAGYIQHNTSIGLQCFAMGPLIIPSLFTLCYNGAVLGTAFGYMARSDVESGGRFFEFVTAHGAFELTAIVLSAAAGLRLGVGLFFTGGMERLASFQFQATKALPVIVASAILFFLAAFTEGFISPSPLPYAFKAAWAIVSSGMLMFYFVVLGYPRGDHDAV